MVKSLLLPSFLMLGLLAAPDESQTGPGLVPVRAIITVEARHKNEQRVPALGPLDVMAYERRDKLQVTRVTPFSGDKAGLELFILVDDASATSLGSQLGDIRRFIEEQSAKTSVGIGYLRNGGVLTLQELTADHGLAAKKLRLPLSSPDVMPSPYLSLRDLIKRWPESVNRREVVLITSGIDPLGGLGTVNPYVDAAIEDAQRNGIVVFAIYAPAAGHAGHRFWALNWAQSRLAQTAEETGGECYMLGFGPAVSFVPYLDEIAQHLTHQYSVEFMMQVEPKAGLRAVRFVTEIPNAELVAPARVFVPGEGSKR